MSQRIFGQSFWFSTLIVAALLLTGCETLTIDKFKIRDDSARSYGATLISRPEELRYGRRNMMQGGVEFAYERYRGDDVQSINPNHVLSLESGSIYGPQQSFNSADIHHGHFAYNQLFTLGRHFQFEAALGVSFDKIEISAQGNLPNSRELTQNQHDFGALLALTPRWNLTNNFAIESRLVGGGNFGETSVWGNTTSFVIMPTPHVALKAGYYTRDYEFQTPGGQSNLQPRFSGFAGTITLIF